MKEPGKSVEELFAENLNGISEDEMGRYSKYFVEEEPEDEPDDGNVPVLTKELKENPVDVPEKLKPPKKEKEEIQKDTSEKTETAPEALKIETQSDETYTKYSAPENEPVSQSSKEQDEYFTFNLPFKRKEKKKSKKKAKDSGSEQQTEPSQSPQESQKEPAASGKPKKKKKKVSTLRLFINLVVKALAVTLGVWALCTFVVAIHIHYGKNMHPAIDDGELVVSLRLDKPYLNGVVIYEKDGKNCVGRVVGLSGSTIDITEVGELKVNGVTAAEEVFYPTFRAENSTLRYPVSVKDGQAFILNDYREDTNDSRTFGCVPLDDIKGPVIFSFRRRGF